LIASGAAYAKGVDWLDEVRGILHSNRDLLTVLMATHLPAARYVPPQATYLAWLDCGPLGWADPAEHCLAHAGVAVTDGGQFRGDGAGHVRLNFATQEELLAEIVERMGKALT
jgi:cystathionine beta-lyase